METAKYAEHAVASMKTNSNKMIHLLSVEKGAGINCILDDFEIDDHSVEPIVVDDIEKDVCLIFWKAASNGFLIKNEHLTHADAFLSAMNLYLYQNHLTGGAISHNCSDFNKSCTLLQLIALERKTTYILEFSKKLDMEENEYSDEDQGNNTSNTLESTDDEDLENFISNAVDPAVAEIYQEQSVETIQAYYKLHKTNPPWQKDRGGEFACLSCNLDCKTQEGLEKHLNFYHKDRPTLIENNLSNMSNTSKSLQGSPNSDELQGSSGSSDNDSNESSDADLSDQGLSEDESDANDLNHSVRPAKENYSDDNDWQSDAESNGKEYVAVDYNNIPSDDEDENQNHKSDDEIIHKVNVEYEKNCFYCRKTFKEITLYESHYSGCYDRYAYMHM